MVVVLRERYLAGIVAKLSGDNRPTRAISRSLESGSLIRLQNYDNIIIVVIERLVMWSIVYIIGKIIILALCGLGG